MRQILYKKLGASPRPVLRLVGMHRKRFGLRFRGVRLEAAGKECECNRTVKRNERT